jgi:hypothetical protein
MNIDSETAISGELHTTMNSRRKPFQSNMMVRASNNEFSVSGYKMQ